MPTGEDALTYATTATTGFVRATDWATIPTTAIGGTVNYGNFQPHISIGGYVSDYDFERFKHELYKFIEEHTKIDVSEEEFMNILGE